MKYNNEDWADLTQATNALLFTTSSVRNSLHNSGQRTSNTFTVPEVVVRLVGATEVDGGDMGGDVVTENKKQYI